MYELIKEFPEQLRKALAIGEKATFNTTFHTPLKNIVICGLGGSGIGGNLLAELLRDELTLPVVVNRGYFLPNFTDASTLVILCSYSGNTEETVSCAQECISKGFRPVCITSGGKLADLANEQKFDLITIPSGFPPRACLGYALVQLFFVLENFKLINNAYRAAFAATADFLESEQKDLMRMAEEMAPSLIQKVVILYAEDKYESVALRIKQQVNENGKQHCWFNAIPEMNHNELVGWREPNKALGIVVLRAEDEYARTAARLTFSTDVIRKTTDNVHEVKAKGANTYEKHFYLIHFGDWLSYYLAVKQGYDPTEIEVLLKLKSHMSSIK